MANRPDLHNSAKPRLSNGQTTFTYLDSYSRPITETKPLLRPSDILGLVRARSARFASGPPGIRESEASRAERKYIAAHPTNVLDQVWNQANEAERGELEMMWRGSSHHGISDPAWAAQHAKPTPSIYGDDGQPLEIKAVGNRYAV